ncbi:MAG: AAA family ATPase [Nocardioidaceae bacterium]
MVIFDPWGREPAAPADDVDGFKRSWQPVDLDDVLSGTWEPPQPTVGRRADGVGLFYPGKVHTVASESEAGKTWFALSAVVDELAAGNAVAYLDFEDDEGGIAGRLLALQVDADVIRDRFRYIRPTEALGTGIHLDDLRAAVLDPPTTSLAVVDGITEAMGLHGYDPIANKDVAAFGRILPRRIANLGPAVVCLDHLTKAVEGRGRYAIGGAHKLNGLDGAAYILENRAPFGIGITGRSTLKLAKDRPGQLRRHGLASSGGLYWFGDLVLDSHDMRFAEVEVRPPSEHQSGDGDFRPTVLMGRIAAALTEHGPLAQRRIIVAVRGKTAAIKAALDLLILDGYVSEGSPHALIKPYVVEGD